MGSLKAGFDTVSTHIGLILLPVLLDVFLWLGPRLSVYRLLQPTLDLIFEQPRLTLTAPVEIERFTEMVQRFNLFSLIGRLQTFPIGISSLLAQTMPVENPLGAQPEVQISSVPLLVALSFLFTVAGWILGGVYFHWVSGTALGETALGASAPRAILQSLLLSTIWVIGLVVLFIPLMVVLTLLATFSPLLASAAVFVLLILSFWVVVPLFFTPHGIFVRRQNAFYSIFTSLRMARFALPTSGLFVLCWFLLTIGLNYLWSIPSESSWMTLVGIGGHAFIATALLAASFVYYRDMNAWLQTVYERLQQKKDLPTQRV